MSLKNGSVMTGATGITVVAGSALALTTGPNQVQNGIQVIAAADTDYRIRRNATFKVKTPTLSADGIYSKDKLSATYVAPKILASGKTVFNLVRVEREIHPESTAAEKSELLLIGAQLLNDSDYTSFWSAGSLE